MHQASSLPVWLQDRYQLLRYFATYMEENLTEAGDTRSSRVVVGRGAVIPHVRRWDRTPKSIIMQLSNGTFQVRVCLLSFLKVCFDFFFPLQIIQFLPVSSSLRSDA